MEVKYLTFKLLVTDKQKKYLHDNMVYRHHLYNNGIDCIRTKRHYNTSKVITKEELTKFMYHKYEKSLTNRSYYVHGIASVTADDLLKLIDKMDNNGVAYKSLKQKFRLERFGNKYGNFGFETIVTTSNGNLNKVCGLTDNSITIRMTPKHTSKFYIDGSLYDNYSFSKDDIKKIFFVHNNGKYTITLAIDNTEEK